MRLILLGPPGAGKGTQASFLAEKFGLVKVSSGDILRAAVRSGSKLGVEANKYMAAGKLVPDNIIIDLILDRVSGAECVSGFLLDGFPRTKEQAVALTKAGIDIDNVIEIKVPDNVIVSRMSGRLFHPGSGRTYHIISNPPLVTGKDDITGEDLVVRDDDKASTVRDRLDVYHAQTIPVLAYYEGFSTSSKLSLCSIDGSMPIGAVSSAIFEFLRP
ncbi:MAG: adenylate kinase [Legionellales bacterium]|jgi:adenylate kinase|nr:adenylate kinase [Legionellales bacterium]